MKATARHPRISHGLVLVCAVLGSLTACDGAGQGSSALPATVSCSAAQFGPQDPKAGSYLGLTEERARALASSQQKRVDIIGQDGSCKAHVDLNLSSIRVQVYLERGKVTWSRIG